MNKHGSGYVLSLSLSSSRHRPVILSFGYTLPIYDIRVLWRWVSLGILRSEALPNRGDHLREPVYSQLFILLLSKPLFHYEGKERETRSWKKQKKSISPEHV
jgi:hypothetical protein